MYGSLGGYYPTSQPVERRMDVVDGRVDVVEWTCGRGGMDVWTWWLRRMDVTSACSRQDIDFQEFCAGV